MFGLLVESGSLGRDLVAKFLLLLGVQGLVVPQSELQLVDLLVRVVYVLVELDDLATSLALLLMRVHRVFIHIRSRRHLLKLSLLRLI